MKSYTYYQVRGRPLQKDKPAGCRPSKGRKIKVKGMPTITVKTCKSRSR